jgi:DNA-binding transcriptional ArsR family regulator
LAPDAASRLAALDQVIEALAHPARRQILMTIHFRNGAMSAGDIAARFEHTWATTTRHLQVLEAAGLVVPERQGRARIYSLRADRLDLVTEWLAWFKKDKT